MNVGRVFCKFDIYTLLDYFCWLSLRLIAFLSGTIIDFIMRDFDSAGTPGELASALKKTSLPPCKREAIEEEELASLWQLFWLDALLAFDCCYGMLRWESETARLASSQRSESFDLDMASSTLSSPTSSACSSCSPGRKPRPSSSPEPNDS